MSVSLRLSMAFFASVPSGISTKAKPRGRPVSRSMMTLTFATSPCWASGLGEWRQVQAEELNLVNGGLLSVISPVSEIFK
jgi:hypothetical protein